MQDFIASGWEHNRATVITFFQDQALAAGRSASDGTAHWLKYQAAMEAGNATLMGDLEQQALDWNDINASSATESEEAWAESYTAQTVTSTAMTDEAIANSLRLKDAVVAHTVEILAGWTAMVEGMELAWGGHEDADNGLGGMQLSATAFREAMVGEGVGGTFGKVTDWAIGGFQAMGESWREHMHGMVEEAQAAAAGINKSLDSIPDRAVTVTTVHRSVYEGGGGVGAGGGGGGVQPIVINNKVSLSRREVTTAVAEDVFREVRRRVGS